MIIRSLFIKEERPLLMWIFVCIFYIIILIFTGTLLLWQWQNYLKITYINHITVQIPTLNSDRSVKETKQLMVDNLSQLTFVNSLHVYSNKELVTLMKPWVGRSTTRINQLPLPILVFVGLTHYSSKTLENIRSVVLKISPNAVVSTNRDFAYEVTKKMLPVQFTFWEIDAVLFISIIVLTLFSSLSLLHINKTRIHILHLIGANNQFIVNRFRRYVFFITTQAAVIALILIIATLFALKPLVLYNQPWIGNFVLQWDKWLLLVGIIIVNIVIIDGVVRLASNRYLNRSL